MVGPVYRRRARVAKGGMARRWLHCAAFWPPWKSHWRRRVRTGTTWNLHDQLRPVQVLHLHQRVQGGRLLSLRAAGAPLPRISGSCSRTAASTTTRRGASPTVTWTVLDFRNARVNSFTQFETGPNPFLGAEETLETIVFREDSTLPDSWQLLARLAKLAKLEFRNMAHLELTSDFNQLPATIDRVYIYNSTIGYVHPRWLSQLKALKLVIIRDTNLNRFLRSMLPRPASFLTELDLERNTLTSLPLDIGEEMPLLQFLNVGRNNITTIDERSLAPLRRNTTYVYLFGNPLRCDCKLRFVVGYQEEWTYSECAQPERLKGRYLGVLGAHELTCDAAEDGGQAT
ncbi:hypothetical protein HPB48_012341 [Haemaphysalis longicornis]|uniref:Uncharacterized protein n=1 Tax=Haemaphysalis longicornis TaxID=44386 RepID=A0A9J6G3D7_HAELO|nr:hypothetical protein HPB48_012341 [Haemaphysalis longicornis]